ncbi:hypothetical protein QYM36_012375 [Artemia franciscana]|uniref:Uncharacterized protein n=1 Tax=Artemia franciscana TaxID=6661 RepID=A0AA88HH12_ARTSF|nr:hypothetical protein QYM36_012375 [Artemia franciscana]
MNQQKEPMILHKIPDYPFQHVAAEPVPAHRTGLHGHCQLHEQQREKAQEAQGKHYNQHARNMEPLKMGQKVRVQLADQGTWKKATVCKTGDSPCSYYVRLEEGGTFRRNRIHIKSRQNPMVTDLHDGASCQVETSSVLPSKNVPDPLVDFQETTDPPTVESPTPKQGVTNKEAEATDPAQAEQINHSFWSSGETPNKVEFVEKKGDGMN